MEHKQVANLPEILDDLSPQQLAAIISAALADVTCFDQIAAKLELYTKVTHDLQIITTKKKMSP